MDYFWSYFEIVRFGKVTFGVTLKSGDFGKLLLELLLELLLAETNSQELL